jgi:periplasmic protein CpxP/Spy
MMKTQIATLLFSALVAGAPFAAAPASGPGGGTQSMPMMNEHMQKMQKQMQQIHAAKDPAERKRLMEEHMKSMQGMMPMMSGMGASPNSDPNQRMQMMEMRMDMMHKMMEQMLQHDAVEHKDHK